MSDTDTDYPEFRPEAVPVPEYSIVTAFNEADLERLVTARMAAGWLPQGGLQVTLDRRDGYSKTDWHFHQAMRK